MKDEIMSYIYLLYKALRHKRPDFQEKDYIWKIGDYTMQKLLREVAAYTKTEEVSVTKLNDYGYLFGIKVERDNDEDGLRLMEDITLKL